tara:strand:- start:327 stop:1001 length:675 start_codon:yes stop_codon:yes gene_type:complete
MSIKYDFDFADVTKTLDVVNAVKKYGICRVPNYLNVETISKLKSESLELVTKESKDDYEFGKATRFERHLNTMPTIASVFSNVEMSKISELYMGQHTLNSDIFITHDYKHDNGLARNGFLHFDRIYTFKFFIYLTDVNKDCGPFSVVPKSHIKGKELRLNVSGQYEELKNRILLDYPELGYTVDEVVPVLGNAGDLIIFDTDLFHLGGVVKENNERLIIRGHTR